ncbi:hypothetical protein [Halalkalibacterium halodurans]|uniref:hypothetical protein n=1 Tax=Halalkalibacterium halodurans TaxID=86665 RepID=UPI002AA9CF01|nr:hypothetical protein [Halalkalibacterium halodurans]MDY7222670.1 hypothetical protein [Halalkalibacterium halodurans]MDY7241891.1 hypothetical protein [Halalkalibacterium halodurans]
MFELHFITKIYHSIIASLLFWFYLARGFVVYGMFSSTCSMLTVMHTIRTGITTQDLTIKELFALSYKKYSTYKLGSFLFTLIILLIYMCLYFVTLKEGLSSLLLSIILIYLFALVWVVFSFAAYFIVFKKCTLKDSLIYAFITAIKKFFLSFSLIIVLTALFYLSQLNLMLFIVSFPALYSFTVLFLLGNIHISR